MKSKTLLKKRAWLNKTASGTGSIFVEVRQEEWKHEGKTNKSVETTFEIRDCSRTVNLDFSLYTNEKGTEKSDKLQKIDRLIDYLIEFREALEEAYEWKESQDAE